MHGNIVILLIILHGDSNKLVGCDGTITWLLWMEQNDAMFTGSMVLQENV